MSIREIHVTDLIGRRVRDPRGRVVGRVEELICEIQLHAEGRDYVVRELHVGAVGFFEAFAGSTLARALFRTMGGGWGYTRYRVPWEVVDLANPGMPRITVAVEELAAV